MLTFRGMVASHDPAPSSAAAAASPVSSAADIVRAAKDAAVSKAGGAPALAARLGITPKAIYQWPHIPAERVGAIAELTGIPPHELRPDVFPAPLGPRDPVVTSVGE